MSGLNRYFFYSRYNFGGLIISPIILFFIGISPFVFFLIRIIVYFNLVHFEWAYAGLSLIIFLSLPFVMINRIKYEMSLAKLVIKDKSLCVNCRYILLNWQKICPECGHEKETI